jgi:hypothetical protein
MYAASNSAKRYGHDLSRGMNATAAQNAALATSHAK